MLCVGFSACSKQSDFDAQSYVKSSLDAEYHREYADHANLMEISEEDVKKQVEENFNESIRQQFASSDNITEEEIAAYTEKMAEVKKMAKYKVQDEKKDEDGNYTVSVKVEPSDVFQTLQQSSAEVSKEKIAQGMKETDLQSLAHFNKMDAHRPRIRVFDLWQAEGRNQFTVTLLNII